MNNAFPKLSSLFLLFVLVGHAGAQPPQLPDPLYAEGFETGTGTWQSIGGDAKIAVEAAPDNVKVGQKSLRFDYNVQPGKIDLIVNPITPPSVATLQSISFWVKANHDAPLVFTVQEQNGGRFGVMFSVMKDQWQRVEITPADLVLLVGKDDPADGNGQLDVDKIEGMALVDYNQLFAQLLANTNSPLAKMLGIETGPRTLFLDDLTVSGKPLEAPPVDETLIDNFSHPQANWFSVGNVTLKTVHDPKPENNALQVDYTQAAGRLSAFAKLLPPGLLAGKAGLSFNVVSKRHATVIVQLEEKSGGKYNAILDVSGDNTPALKTLKFADFKPADDSKDDDGRLDLETVKQLLLIDMSGMLGADGGENTLWLNQIRAQ